jgi:hypothetical protein
MSPERLLKEPWRLGMFFALVFGTMILCIAVLLWQQEVGNDGTHRTQQLILVALQKSDRNNQSIQTAIDTTRQVYEAGEKARGQLIAMVAEEKQMNITLLRMNRCLIQMNLRLLASQNWMRAHMKRLEKLHR